MNDLREQLAQRLKTVAASGPCLASHSHNHTGMQWPSCPPPEMDGNWLKVADEVIRQMEWASAEAHKRTIVETMKIDQNKFPGMRGVRVLGKHPLTLAPENWTPRVTSSTSTWSR